MNSPSSPAPSTAHAKVTFHEYRQGGTADVRHGTHCRRIHTRAIIDTCSSVSRRQRAPTTLAAAKPIFKDATKRREQKQRGVSSGLNYEYSIHLQPLPLPLRGCLLYATRHRLSSLGSTEMLEFIDTVALHLLFPRVRLTPLSSTTFAWYSNQFYRKKRFISRFRLIM